MVADDNVVEIGQGYHALYHNIMVRRAYGYGVITGGIVSPGSDGGVSVDVTSGSGVENGSQGSIPSKNSLTLASPDPNDPRRDLIVWNGADVIDITGTPNPKASDQSSATRFELYQPSPPDTSGTGYVVLAEVFVQAGASTINPEDINDLRTDPALNGHGLRLTDDVTTEGGTTLLDESEGQVGNGTVDSDAIQNDAVISAKIAQGQVTATEIAANAVANSELNQGITPTWTGVHTFNEGLTANDDIEAGEGVSRLVDRDDVSAATTTDGSEYYRVDTSGGDVTLTLSADDATDQRKTSVKNVGGGTTTVETEASATIEGESSVDLDQDGQSLTLVYNNAEDDWEIF